MSELNKQKLELNKRLQEALRGYEKDLGTGDSLTGVEYVQMSNYMDYIEEVLEAMEENITGDING